MTGPGATETTQPPGPAPGERDASCDDEFPLAQVRLDFPALSHVPDAGEEPRLAYLDSAATALTPSCVIEAVAQCQREGLGAVGRGVHRLSARAGERYAAARRRVSEHFGVGEQGRVVFVRGTTEALNLVAQSWARPRLAPGDEVLVSELEHHSNLLPWQVVCAQTGARLVVVPIDEQGTVGPLALAEKLSERTRVVALTHVSNVLGSVLPVAELARAAREVGASVVIDGAQAAGHLRVDFTQLGCDFYAFSGHKLYGPDGIGVLLSSREQLEAMAPYQVGGGMARRVERGSTSYVSGVERFEAGTPNVSGAVGLAAALDYLDALGLACIEAHERRLTAHARERLAELPGLTLLPATPQAGALLSFVLDGVHAHDIGTVADTQGVALRTGHHCAQPLMARLGQVATARASFGVYSGQDDVDALVDALRLAVRLLR